MQLAAVPWNISKTGPSRIVVYRGGERAAVVSISNQAEGPVTLYSSKTAKQGDKIPSKSTIIVVTTYAALEAEAKDKEAAGYMGVSFPPSA